ncbi:MAG: SpoIIE family protein phosphatase [Oscillospiraceae bacterium]|nr:SpoIIE family protein phosphatase [Oscillospiraceae bacterium]
MAFYDASFYKKRRTRALIAAGVTAAVEFVYLFAGDPTGKEVLECFAAVALTGVSCALYADLLKGGSHTSVQMGRFFAAVSLLLCGADFAVWGLFSPCRIAVGALVLYCAQRCDAGLGAAAGFAAGALLDAATGGASLVTTALFTLFGLGSAFLASQTRTVISAVIFSASACFVLPYAGDSAGALLGETMAAFAVFCCLPRKETKGKRMQARENAGDKLRQQLTDLSAAFHEVYDMLSDRSSEEEDPAVIFDRSAETVCRGCTLCSLCWKEDYISTFNAFNDATPVLLERGRAQARDFPVHFSGRCIHFADLLSAINTELSAYLVRTGYRRRLAESQKHLRRQYAQISELFRTTAASVGRGAVAVSAVPQNKVLSAVALTPKKGESVSGDTAEVFALDNGLTYLLLSDGAGTGEAARRESALAVRLLRHFLSSGIDVSTALRTLNEAFVLKGNQGGAFATVDLAEVDPRTGEVAFYKFGAAPSYIKRGIDIRRMTGTCLPAGLQSGDCPPDVLRTSLGEGEYVVLLSDGVADMLSDEWLQNLLAGWQGEDPEDLAGCILRYASQRSNGEDDSTVIAARLQVDKNGAKAV